MKIGVIGAMEEELIPLRAWFRSVEKLSRGRRTYFDGEAFGHELFLTRSDPGKVNGALAAQALLDHFDVDLILNLGSSGALASSLDVGDLVVATEFIQHDFDVTAFGLAPGELLFNLVMNPETGATTFERKRVFSAHPVYSELAHAIGTRLEKAGALSPVLGRVPRVFSGRAVSGDQFIGHPATAERLRKDFDALCADMEAAAIAQVCELSGTPFVCVRAISDKADHSALVSFSDFLKIATANYGKLFEGFLAELPR